MAQSKTARSLAKPPVASAAAAQVQKLPTRNWKGAAIRNPAVGLKGGDTRETEDPLLAVIGSGNRKYSTDQIMRMTRGDGWNQP